MEPCAVCQDLRVRFRGSTVPWADLQESVRVNDCLSCKLLVEAIIRLNIHNVPASELGQIFLTVPPGHLSFVPEYKDRKIRGCYEFYRTSGTSNLVRCQNVA